jgi:hypothetical protein
LEGKRKRRSYPWGSRTAASPSRIHGGGKRAGDRRKLEAKPQDPERPRLARWKEKEKRGKREGGRPDGFPLKSWTRFPRIRPASI